MTYQAVVRDGNNNLVANGLVGVRVTILQGSSSGNAVFSERHMVTTNANGLVTFQIGSGNAIFGLLSNVDWAAGPYWIKTETDPTGGTTYSVAGTSQLISVPYALYAANAGNPGLPGATGPTGATGLDGAPGAQGPTGAAGLNGASGVQGPTGLTGATGATGIDGAQGPQGQVGLTGATGATGLTGSTGAQGLLVWQVQLVQLGQLV